MTTFEAGGGDVGLSALTDPGAACDSGDEIGLTISADPPSEVPGEMGPGAHGDPAGEVNVPLGEDGVLGESLLCLLEEDADTLQSDLLDLSVRHSGCLFIGFWVWE